jgi:hypothetical protein
MKTSYKSGPNRSVEAKVPSLEDVRLMAMGSRLDVARGKNPAAVGTVLFVAAMAKAKPEYRFSHSTEFSRWGDACKVK